MTREGAPVHKVVGDHLSRERGRGSNYYCSLRGRIRVPLSCPYEAAKHSTKSRGESV